jgi:hypothetical protein
VYEDSNVFYSSFWSGGSPPGSHVDKGRAFGGRGKKWWENGRITLPNDNFDTNILNVAKMDVRKV